MTEHTELIKRGDLDKTLSDLLLRERLMLETEEKILPGLDEGTIKDSLVKDITKRKEFVTALEEGFVPVDVRGVVRTDTKDKWNKGAVKRALASMPEEAKQAWEEAEKLGIFKSFSITSYGADPVLVGNAGGKRFLIAAWIRVVGGSNIGFRVRLERREVMLAKSTTE